MCHGETVQHRRTKILATLGPASMAPETIMSMIQAGVDGLRINAAHGSPEDWREQAKRARHAADITGRAIAIVFDLAGPKIRLSPDVETRAIAQGEEVVFTSGESDNGAIEVEWPEFAAAATPGVSEIVIGDGTPRFAVTATEAPLVMTRCERPGMLGPRKGAFVTHSSVGAAALTGKDLDDLEVAAEIGVDFVSLSFVRRGEDIDDLRDRLRGLGSHARIIAKIEKLEAVEALDELIQASDAIMVARGDLGVEVGAARVPLLQKEIIRKATRAGRLVITATQMLESMIDNAEPTRAEASDVSNAVLDGSSAVMMSGETAIGAYPVEAVQAMDEIARAAQAGELFHREITAEPESAAEAVIQAAVHLASQLNSAALVIPTRSGGSARAAAKYRPSRPIVGLAENATIARQLSLEWGVIAGTLPSHPGSVENLVNDALWSARSVAGLRNGDRVVMAMGRFSTGSGNTDLITVRRIGEAPPPDHTQGIDPAFG